MLTNYRVIDSRVPIALHQELFDLGFAKLTYPLMVPGWTDERVEFGVVVRTSTSREQLANFQLRPILGIPEDKVINRIGWCGRPLLLQDNRHDNVLRPENLIHNQTN